MWGLRSVSINRGQVFVAGLEERLRGDGYAAGQVRAEPRELRRVVPGRTAGVGGPAGGGG